MGAKTLAAAEAARLVECESIIADGIDTFMSVGNALLEIRDSKLYRATHKSFDAYRQERWGIGKSRAYQLIDHAKAVEAISEASGKTSTTVDISERDTRAIKADLPAVVEDIKARREAGEAPGDAAKNAIEAKRREREEAAKAKAAEAADRAEKTAAARRKRDEEQAENDRQRQAVADALPDAIKARQQAKANAARKSTGGEPDADTEALEARISELEDEHAALKEDIAAVRKENAFYADMKTEYEQGGFEEIVSGLKQQIAVLGRQVETESADKAAWAKSAKLWRRRAEQLGWSNEEVIDLREGANG